MSRMVSFAILIFTILLMGAAFVLVMSQFLLPMFVALLLVVMFRPLHERLLLKCHGRNRVAAGFTTAAILLIVLVPTLLILFEAAREGVALANPANQEKVRQAIVTKGGHLLESLRQTAGAAGYNLPPDKELVQTAAGYVEVWIAPAALRTTQFLGSFVLGFFIMLVSLYFFLADGPSMVDAAMRLSPLDIRYVKQLLEEFDRVSRAVVLATLLAALGQGVMAGIGYLLTGLNATLLLTVMTILLALVPFVGAAAVWGSCCLWLYFYEERTGAALFLLLWGLCVVSLIDNVIKPYVLHGQSNLHPLLALLSVLGGIQVLGPIGIFIGPMVVAFFQALLSILRMELDSMETASGMAKRSGEGVRG